VQKRFEGRDEPVLFPEIAIVDSHHHLFDRPTGRYLFEDYLSDINLGHKVVASVYVETLAMARQDGPELLRPLGEVEFANGVGAMSASGTYGPSRVAAAIVGYADLSAGPEVGELLDRAIAAAPDRFRGVRQLTMDHPDEALWRFVTNRPAPGLLHSPGFRPGFAQLAARGLSFDAAVLHHQLPEIGDLAGAFPETTIVLNHMGQALGLDRSPDERIDAFTNWRAQLQELAQRPNVVCKIGGLGLPFWGFGFERRTDPIGYLELAETWRPFVETAIEAFGVDRCMMESNFPADGRSCGFVPLWNALKHIVRDASDDEKATLFRETATRVYRIE
jgi:L-fuconolactonase